MCGRYTNVAENIQENIHQNSELMERVQRVAAYQTQKNQNPSTKLRRKVFYTVATKLVARNNHTHTRTHTHTSYMKKMIKLLKTVKEDLNKLRSIPYSWIWTININKLILAPNKNTGLVHFHLKSQYNFLILSIYLGEKKPKMDFITE